MGALDIMDLRAKTFLIIGLTFLAGFLLIIIFSFTLLTDSYAKFEQDDVKQKVHNALKVLDYEKRQLETKVGDWSRWDESYDFVQDLDEEYINRNLNYDSIVNIDIDFLIFVRKDNSVKCSTRINPSTKSMELMLDKTVEKVISTPGILTSESILEGKSGFINIPEGPSLISSFPIITSTYEGPSVGWLIFGSYLDDNLIGTLSDISEQSLSINWIPSDISLSSPLFPGDLNLPVSVFPESDTMVSGSVLIPTLDSDGYLQLTTRLSRDIITHGKDTIITYLIILMLLGLVIIVVSLVMVDQLVMSRLHSLIDKIKNRGSKQFVPDEFHLEGDDEFTVLAREISPIFLELSKSRKQLEEHILLLTESERKYRELADLLPEFVFESDLNGNISFLNQMGLGKFGYDTGDYESGLHILNIIDTNDHQRFLDLIQRISEGKLISGSEFSGHAKNGDILPMVMYAAPIKTGTEIVGLRGFAIDISERKGFEKSLQKLANIVEHTSTGIITGTGDLVDYVNHAYSSMHGMQPENFIGNSPFLAVQKYPDKNFLTYLESAIHSGHIAFELDHTRKDGTEFPALHDLTVFSGTTAEHSFWSMNVQDFSEQRQAFKTRMESEALRESSRHLRDVISRLPDATFVIDKDGWVIIWNHAMEILTGIQGSDIIGRGKKEYAIPFYGEERPMLLNAVLDTEGVLPEFFPDASRSGDSFFIEENFPKMGTGGKYFSSMAGPLYDSKGGIIGAIQSMRDITPRILAERALIRTNEKLNLLSSITRHDIRNRVSVILGLLPLLKNNDNEEEMDKIMTILQDAAKMIQDQIEFTRVYQDLGIHSPEWSDVGILVNKVSEIGIPKQVRIVNELSGLMVYADPLLERVFYNLIDNAIRHGGNSLSYIRFSWFFEESRMCIVCDDDGQGIPDDLKETIFERGYGSNTGLGLFLVREILSITGISIVETGIFGKGARFEISVSPEGFSVSDKE
ncbi:MAG: PAS domain S-box protein [Methanomicrobiales archaeon]|nr:PAS domain S-box protein [Methanomicrobiales archaeon]